jgi:hypothetical protein
MWYYGAEPFNELRTKIRNALLKFRRPFILPDFEFYTCRFRGERDDQLALPEAQGDSVQTTNMPTTTEKNDKTEVVGTTSQTPAVTYVEQTDTTTAISVKHGHPEPDSCCPQVPWNIDSVIGKPIRAGSYAWSTATTAGTILKTFSFPDWFFNTTVTKSMFSSFVFWKGCPRIRIELDGTRFHQGSLIAWWAPQANITDCRGWVNNRPRITTLQHAFLDASKNSVVEFDIPWFYYRNYYDLLTGAPQLLKVTPLGTLNISIFNQLQTSGGSANLFYTVSISSTNNEFQVPVASVVTQGASDEIPLAQGMADYMDKFKRIIDVVLPNNIVGDFLDVAVKMSNMDKPANTLNPMPMVRRPFAYLGHADDIDNVDRLALHPGGTTKFSEIHTGTTEDEMSLKYLFSKMTWCTTFNFMDTVTAGSPIWTMPMQPLVLPGYYTPAGTDSITNYDTNSSPQQYLYFPLLGFTAMPFDYWRGGMKIKFQFLSTYFHTAKFCLTLNYGYYLPSFVSGTLEEASQYAYYFELNGEKKCFEFEIPYMSATSWKRMPNFSMPAVPSNESNCWARDSSMGYMTLQLVNQLVHPDNVANNVDVNVFIGGMPDFEVNYVSGANKFIPIAQGESEQCDSHKSSFQGTKPCGSNNMSEEYTSIRSLLKRYNHVYDQTFAIETVIAAQSLGHAVGNILGVAGPPQPYTPNSFQNTSFPLMTYYSTMYRAHRGSFREKFYVNLTSTADTPVDYLSELMYFPTVNLDPAAGDSFPFQSPQLILQADLSTTPQSSVQGGFITYANGADTYFNAVIPPHTARSIANHTAPFHEYEIPYVSTNNHRLIPIGGNGSYASYRTVPSSDFGFSNAVEASNCGAVVVTITAASALADVSIDGNIVTYIAAGDDFRMFGLLGPSPLQYNPVLKTTAGATTPFSLMPDRWINPLVLVT